MPRLMRLVMTTDAVGGVWRYAIDAGSALMALGVEVTLVGLGPAPTVDRRAEAEAAGLPLAWLDGPLDWSCAGEEGLERSGSALAGFVRRHGADVVHVNAPALLPWVEKDSLRVAAVHSCLATWWRAVKTGPLPETWRWHRDATATALAEADRAIAPTRAFAVALEAEYGPLPRLHVVCNGVRPVEPAFKRPCVLAAGRWWDEGKNLAGLDAAAARAAWPVCVAGPMAADSASAPPLRTAVWVGELCHREMRARLAEAGIFASPSLYEPFGLAVLEAATAGAALVLADIPTFRELWDGAALFADPRDPVALANAINRLALDDRLRVGFATAARARAQLFSLPTQAAALMRAYGREAAGWRVAV
jgi:glycosyltransferase involved in cell wall biosynthesis